MERKKLPISESSFEVIRENKDYYYVDKTPFVFELVKRPWGAKFLSRPRRFGKSLLLDTLRCLYEGKKELFEGLYIYDKWDWSKTHPVIYLRFSRAEPKTNKEWEDDLTLQLNSISSQYEFSLLDRVSVPGVLGGLITRMYYQLGKKVVLLIDDFDAPMRNMLKSEEDVAAMHHDMKGILRLIKSYQGYCEFVLISSVLHLNFEDGFSAVDVTLNISLEEEYNEICGFTEQELVEVFAPEFEQHTEGSDISIDSFRQYYCGYRWTGESSLYNPIDILMSFDKGRISNWFGQYGLDSHVIEFVAERTGFYFDCYAKVLDLFEFWCGMRIESMDLLKVLFETGYMTVKSSLGKSYNREMYLLGSPNLDVKRALARLQMKIESKSLLDVDTDFSDIQHALRQHDPESLKSFICQLLSKFTYTEGLLFHRDERFSMLMKSILISSGFSDIMDEVPTKENHADMVICDQGQYYVMGFKLLGSRSNERGCAISHIKESNYASRFKEDGRVFLVGFEFTETHVKEKPNEPKVALAYVDMEELPTKFTPVAE